MKLRSVLLQLMMMMIIGAPTLVAAQRGPGLLLGSGLGVARFRSDCADCGGVVQEDGAIGTFSLGYAFSARLRASAEVMGWFGAGGSVLERQGSATATLQYFPMAKTPVFLEGGAGIARYKSPVSADESAPVFRANGVALRLGVGMELPLDQTWSLVPKVTYISGPSGELTLDGGDPLPEYSVSQGVFAFGIGFQFRVIQN